MGTTDAVVPFAVICEYEACERFGAALNEFAVPETDVEMLCEAFGQGAEGPVDYCPSCGVLGVLSELDRPGWACAYCTDETERVAAVPVRTHNDGAAGRLAEK